jgi:hypothetical protein
LELDVDVPSHEPDLQGLSTQLSALGMSGPDAATMSVLSVGSFDDFVRLRAHQLGIGVDTIVGRADEHAPASDDQDAALIVAFLSAVLAGETAHVELDESQMRLLADVLHQTPGTITALRATRTGPAD